MTEEERKKHYKRGLWKVTPIFFYPNYNYCVLKANHININEL